MVQNPKFNRRRFLKTFGGAAAAGSASVVLMQTASDEAKAYNPGQDERRARYNANAPDVQAFYRTNGYETLKK